MNNEKLNKSEIAKNRKYERIIEKHKKIKHLNSDNSRINCLDIPELINEKNRGEFVNYIELMQESFEIMYMGQKRNYTFEDLKKEYNVCQHIILDHEKKWIRFLDVTTYSYPFQRYILSYEDIIVDNNDIEDFKKSTDNQPFKCLTVFNHILDEYYIKDWDIRELLQKNGGYNFYEKDKYILTYLIYIAYKEGIGTNKYVPDPITNEIILDCLVHLLISNGEDVFNIETYMYKFQEMCIAKFNIDVMINSLKKLKIVFDSKNEKNMEIKKNIYYKIYEMMLEINSTRQIK